MSQRRTGTQCCQHTVLRGIWQGVATLFTTGGKTRQLSCPAYGGPILSVEMNFNGELAGYDLAPVTNSFLKGLLRPRLPMRSTMSTRHWWPRSAASVSGKQKPGNGDFANLISAKYRDDVKAIACRTVNQNGEPRIVSLDGCQCWAIPCRSYAGVPI